MLHTHAHQIHVAGAVAVRLRVHDSGLLFISSHLSSGEHDGDELKRNYDYSEIVRRGYFADEFSALDPSVLGAHQQHTGVSKVNFEAISERDAHFSHLSLRFRVPCSLVSDARAMLLDQLHEVSQSWH